MNHHRQHNNSNVVIHRNIRSNQLNRRRHSFTNRRFRRRDEQSEAQVPPADDANEFKAENEDFIPPPTPQRVELKEAVVPNSNSATQIMNSMFQKAGIDPNQMNAALQNANAVVAGSMTLYATMLSQQQNPHWTPNDFDIWVTPDRSKWSDPVEAFHPILNRSGYKLKSSVRGNLGETETPEARTSGGLPDYARLRNWIKIIHIYRMGENLDSTEPMQSVQVMVLQPTRYNHETGQRMKTTSVDIVKSFDLRLVQFWYDGAAMHYFQSPGQSQVIPTSVEIAPEAYEQTIFEWIRTFDRALKYAKRGFSINWKPFFMAGLWTTQNYFGMLNEGMLRCIEFYRETGRFAGREERLQQICSGRTRTPIHGLLRALMKLNRIVYASKDLTNVASKNNDMVFAIKPKAGGYAQELWDFPNDDTNDSFLLLAKSDLGASEDVPVTPLKYGIEFPQTAVRARRRRGSGNPRPTEQQQQQQTRQRTLQDVHAAPFSFPPNWRRESSEPYRRNQAQRSAIQEGQCYDFIMVGEQGISDYLNEDPAQNVVILGAAGEDDIKLALSNAVCTTRQVLQESLQNQANITLACAGRTGGFPVDTSMLFVRLNLREFSVYVPQIDIEQAVSNAAYSVFQISESELTLPATASVDAVVNLNFVSADHCQAGTSKKIYRLHPVEFLGAETPALAQDEPQQQDLQQQSPLFPSDAALTAPQLRRIHRRRNRLNHRRR